MHEKDEPATTRDIQPPPVAGAPERPNQHDLMRNKDLPKKDVASALDDFDGDEN
jgi:hypothetical protein